ncbi:MAG: insulinase family protein [Candidatus Eisenbacteria bacterium]|nr:insulinase family protein [Candidatus Eisenbacteria bacterium]
MARLSRSLLAALLLVGASCARQEPSGPQVRHLQNGLTIIAKPSRAADVVSVQVWVRDGTIYESPRDAGASSVLSELVRPSPALSGAGEAALAVEAVGGRTEAEHSQDHVCYEVTVPGRHLDLALRALSDAVLRPPLEPASVERAKTAVVRRTASLMSRPIDRALQMCLAAIMPRHPTARPPAASASDLAAIDASVLEDWWSRRYVGANMVVVVVGNAEPRDAADRAEKAFSGVAAGERAEPWSSSVEWLTAPARVDAGIETDSERATMMIGFPGPGVSDEDHVAADVLMMALAGSRSSRMSRALVAERGIAWSVGGGWYTRTQASPCFIWMELDPVNALAAEAAVVDVVESLAERPLDADDLARGKALLTSYMVFASETAAQQAAYEGYWFIVADEGYADSYFDRIEAVTVEDLRGAAVKYLRPESRATVVLEPHWVK